MHGIMRTSVLTQFKAGLAPTPRPNFEYSRSAFSFFAFRTTCSRMPSATVQVSKINPAYLVCEIIFSADCLNSAAFRDFFARSVSYIKRLVQ